MGNQVGKLSRQLKNATTVSRLPVMINSPDSTNVSSVVSPEDLPQAVAGELNHGIRVIDQSLLAAEDGVFKVSDVIFVDIAELPLQAVRFAKE